MKQILRKAVVKKQVNRSEYLVEDIFSKETIRMVLSGKMVMNYLLLNIGDEIYVAVASIEPTKGRLITGTEFKEYNELSKLKLELDKRQK